ncbi:MAG TPA: hypothetical protein VIX59_14695 [Candidatus Binataceae bacterium]
MAALPLLAYYWKPIAILLAIASFFIYVRVIKFQRDEARAKVATVSAEVIDLKSAEAECQAAVTTQNSAVAKLRAAADRAASVAATREANVAVAAAAEAARADDRARALEQAPVGPGCDEAIRWGNAQAPELGKW